MTQNYVLQELIGEAAKKNVIFGLATKVLPPSSTSLVATFFSELFFFNVKTSYFFLAARPLPSPPPLSGRAIKKNSRRP